ncbi:MAG: SAM-dependent chlorinase/fluorinase [Sphingomonadales bacterium]|nr:SAM-dependent chlorinase/fluorinase [Sphingomonadales bacterium]
MIKPKLIHVFTDYGDEATESSVSRALLFAQIPDLPHIFSQPTLSRGHLSTAAMFMQMVLPSFGEDTWHLCDITHTKLSPRAAAPYLAAKSGSQWFFAPDNGFLPLILQDSSADYYSVSSQISIQNVMKDIYLPAINTLMNSDNGSIPFTVKENVIKSLIPKPAFQQNLLRLTVVYNDAQGNAIFNLKRDEFERMRNGRRFKLSVISSYRLEIDRISASLFDVDQGYAAAYFGLGDFLQIAMNAGSAKQYYGLSEGTVILLKFMDAS